MKKTEPLKRSPALVSFSQNHHFALLCVWKIREGISRSVSPERISRYALHFFNTDLRYHLHEEEEKVFAKLPKDNAMRVEAEEGHSTIYNLIEALKQNPGNETILKNFADALEKYIHFEERSMFQYLQNVLTEADLIKITNVISPSKHEPEEAWADAFWK